MADLLPGQCEKCGSMVVCRYISPIGMVCFECLMEDLKRYL